MISVIFQRKFVRVLLILYFKKQNGSRSNSRVQDVCRIYSHSVCTFHRLKLVSCSYHLLHCRVKIFLNEEKRPLLRNGRRYEDNTKSF